MPDTPALHAEDQRPTAHNHKDSLAREGLHSLDEGSAAQHPVSHVRPWPSIRGVLCCLLPRQSVWEARDLHALSEAVLPLGLRAGDADPAA